MNLRKLIDREVFIEFNEYIRLKDNGVDSIKDKIDGNFIVSDSDFGEMTVGKLANLMSMSGDPVFIIIDDSSWEYDEIDHIIDGSYHYSENDDISTMLKMMM